MATFTMELRKVVEIVGRDELFNPYPIFDEAYRGTLNNKIIDYFFYREIGFESVDMFRNRLNQKLDLLMPVFNKLYLSTLMEFDPLTTTKLSTHTTGTGEEESTANATANSTASNASNSESSSRAVSSEFPQTLLADNGDYATSATDSTGVTGTTGSATEESGQVQTVAGTRETVSDTNMVGYTSTPSDLLLRYRETLINVDLALMESLEVLFMQVWNNGDEYGDYPTYDYPLYYYGGL